MYINFGCSFCYYTKKSAPCLGVLNEKKYLVYKGIRTHKIRFFISLLKIYKSLKFNSIWSRIRFSFICIEIKYEENIVFPIKKNERKTYSLIEFLPVTRKNFKLILLTYYKVFVLVIVLPSYSFYTRVNKICKIKYKNISTAIIYLLPRYHLHTSALSFTNLCAFTWILVKLGDSFLG